MDANRPFAVVRCDLDGVVEEVVFDPAGMLGRLTSGKNLIHIFPSSVAGKALRFLEALRIGEPIGEWEMATESPNGYQPMLLSGTRAEGRLLIGVAIANGPAERNFEDMARIVNEQATALRHAAKQQFELATSQFQSSTDARFDDLTRMNNELVNLQRELVRKNRELEHLNRLKNELLGMAAHDLRNPLGIISLYSSYLLEELEPALPKEHADLVAEIRTASEFMLALVDDLLDFSTIESGKLQLDRAPTDLHRLVEQNVRRNQVLASRKSIQLYFTARQDLPVITIDTIKIEQVLNNLIGNAVKYSPRGANVRIDIGVERDAIVVAITDQGPGISPAEQDNLFNPFSRLSVRPTGGEKSTGLGLAICRRIIEGHGGKLSLASTPGVGSTFTFALPVDQPDALADRDML